MQVGVAGEVEALAEGLRIIEDVLEAERVQVRQLGRITQRQLVDVLMCIGSEEGEITATTTDFNQVIGDDLAADDHRRDRLGHGVSPRKCSGSPSLRDVSFQSRRR
ncbi:hypothetical protein D3C76_1667160 [compost metagenome]